MELNESKNAQLFDLEHTEARELFDKYEYPWQVLDDIKQFIRDYGKKLDLEQYNHPSEDVWIHKTANVFPSAYIAGPCIIGAETEVRHCAFIRGSAFIGKNCVVGNSTELKNVILFDNVQVPHYNYVGDSVLGYHSHMGAGSITSNVKSDKKDINIHFDSEDVPIHRHKAGAFLGDYVEVGCGTVLNPGTIVGRNTSIYPLSSVRGVISDHSIYKNALEIVVKEKTE